MSQSIDLKDVATMATLSRLVQRIGYTRLILRILITKHFKKTRLPLSRLFSFHPGLRWVRQGANLPPSPSWRPVLTD